MARKRGIARKTQSVPTVPRRTAKTPRRTAGIMRASRALRPSMPSTQQAALASVKRTAGKGREGFFTQRRVPGQVNMSMKGYV